MRRRALVFAVASASAVLVLLALGWWQLERRAWKEGLIAELDAALKPAAAAMEVGDAERLLAADAGRDFARVRLSGRYLEGLDRYLFAVSSGAPGVRVLTPFLTGDGRLALVDRGFVPEDLGDRAAPAAGQATVEGLMHQARKPGLFAPAPDLARHVWYWPDMPALLASLPEGSPGRPLPYLIEALPGAAVDAWPRPDPPDPRSLPNNHLQYAITWFGLAAVCAVMTVVLLGGRGRADPDGPA
jgi:surfeit locus 1 family protein